MSKPARPVRSGTFLITTATYARRQLFRREAHAGIFLSTLQHYREEGYYLLHDFVVMPEHAHLLLTPTNASIERVMGLVQGGFSHKIAGPKPFWQQGLMTVGPETGRSSSPCGSMYERIQFDGVCVSWPLTGHGLLPGRALTR